MTLPGPAFQECTGSYHENVHALKPVSSELRSTGGMTNDLDGDSRHLDTLSTILQPTVAC